MSDTNETFKAIVAFTFHSGTNGKDNGVRDKFVKFLEGDPHKGRKISPYNAEFQDESTYGIEKCNVNKLITDIEIFCIDQQNEKNFNFNEEDFIRVFYANQEEYILMHEIKPSDPKSSNLQLNPEYESKIKRQRKIMYREEK